MDILAFIPSPSKGEYDLFGVPLRGYAFCIIIGVFVGVWLGGRRWIARGGRAGTVADIAVWAVPFGLVGGRLYHVITDNDLYFAEGKNWVDAFKIWEGGLGIWGAIALGALGAWIGCRRRGIPLPAWADAVAPGIAVAQALGRFGNWFNQELYGKATDVPWALKIDAAHSPNGVAGTFHPTFLYESLWCLGVAALVIWADRRFKLGHGRAFALYVAAYCVGRGWIEYMRVDDVQLNDVLGLRFNVWTSIVVFLLAVVYIVVSAKVRPGREEIVEPDPEGEPSGSGDAESGPESESAEGAGAEKVDMAKAEDAEVADGEADDEAKDEAGSAKKA
ncbi:prolipoprotein diacylglyceryl transferase [Streptomyces sp. NBC_01304]|uniref:prolipoprotein diacylglyceryl transferase n=1 Tax=Streptomyces sp. NBC_01304 TaxID=2903818 RepID=UPI002E0E0A9A|nr:prolipoprotein diacylglyceryl transferase [Streptomyces sp. NBC_01304]